MKLAVIFGTRPETIKVAPVIKELERTEGVEVLTITTAQHRDLIDSLLDLFEIKPTYDLNIFKKGQTLSDITTSALKGLEEILIKERPDVCLVQGDTTTVFAGALASFYQNIKLGHIEAGLRSGNIFSPYPEEANRKMVTQITSLHFAPTEEAQRNLLKEGVDRDSVFLTGNTVIDSLKYISEKDFEFTGPLAEIDFDKERVVLLTAHRRENWGKPMEEIFTAIQEVLDEKDDVRLVFPMHPNPKIREVARSIFKDRAILLEPLSYIELVNIQKRAGIVITDSGGIQEEAPFFGVPVLVIREETERPEGVEAGTAKLVGTKYENVKREFLRLLDDEAEYKRMSNAISPYGDGRASERIVKAIMGK